MPLPQPPCPTVLGTAAVTPPPWNKRGAESPLFPRRERSSEATGSPPAPRPLGAPALPKGHPGGSPQRVPSCRPTLVIPGGPGDKDLPHPGVLHGEKKGAVYYTRENACALAAAPLGSWRAQRGPQWEPPRGGTGKKHPHPTRGPAPCGGSHTPCTLQRGSPCTATSPVRGNPAPHAPNTPCKGDPRAFPRLRSGDPHAPRAPPAAAARGRAARARGATSRLGGWGGRAPAAPRFLGALGTALRGPRPWEGAAVAPGHPPRGQPQARWHRQGPLRGAGGGSSGVALL